jgi:LuxR family transcriptional regulator, maltose regulon positive regulatory protein
MQRQIAARTAGALAERMTRPNATARRHSARSNHAGLPPDVLIGKLTAPPPRTNRVRRARLLAQLDAGLRRTLLLVCAPAGFGKTTLISEWVAHRGRTSQTAWLSLDQGDNDPSRFMRYVAAAMHAITPQASKKIFALRGPSAGPTLPLITLLINELAQRRGESVLVLDDYHVIRDPTIHEAITFLLNHTPAGFHLVTVTREDPPFPLARLRSRNAVTEIRQADLRFTPDEAAAFLRDVMRLTLSASDVEILEARTEGWIAGLQLAGLSIQGHADPDAFVKAFGGAHRYILDYLMEEVFSRQSPSVQHFLLCTAILDRLCGPVCDAVLATAARDERTGPASGQAMLERLEHANLFVVPLDGERRWYRYHTLFAELLRLRLRQTHPEIVAALHTRASEWYEQAGLLEEAVAHALAGGDATRTAWLIERSAPPLMYRGQYRVIVDWLNQLPAEAAHDLPYLAVFRALALVMAQDIDAAEQQLDGIRRRIVPALSAVQKSVFQGWIIAVRSVIAHLAGDTELGVTLAKEALPLLPSTEWIHLMAQLCAASEFLITGDVGPHAEQTVAAAARADEKDRDVTVRSLALLARLHVMQGRLRRAAAAYDRAGALVLQETPTEAQMGGRLPYQFGLGALFLERNDLKNAQDKIVHAMEALVDASVLPPDEILRGYAALAGVRQAREDHVGALAAMEAFMDLARRRRYLPALLAEARGALARLHLRHGDVAAAVRWTEESELRVDDEARYPREAQQLTLARVLIAQGRAAETIGLLGRLLESAEAGGRGGSIIEILIVRALARQAQSDARGAILDVTRALALAEPEGYVRLFLNEGRPMAALLRRVAQAAHASPYAAQLLSALEPDAAGPRGSGAAHGGASALVESLTEREREVLRLLAADASNAEIARTLVLTVGTVKTHVHNILGKLEARTRRQAAVKAGDLHLL